MRHPDEGLIHAWLDGAATAEEGRDIQAHIAQCEACAATVAEARGLIAGASRILTGLDHVPGNVIPGGVSAAPIPRPVVQRSRVRRWASRPALRAAAAVVFLAGTSWIVVDQARREDVRFLPGAGDSAMIQAEDVEIAEERAESAAVGAATGAADASLERQSARPPAQEVPGGRGTASPARSQPTSPPASAPTARATDARGAASAGSVGGDRPEVATRSRLEDLVVTSPQSKSATAPAATPGRGGVVGSASSPIGGSTIVPDSIAVLGASTRASAVRSQAERVLPADSAAARIAARSLRSDTSGDLRLRRMERPAQLSEIGVANVPPPPAMDRLRSAALPSMVSGGPGVELAGCYAVSIGRWSGAQESGAVNLPPLLSLGSGLLEITAEGPRLALTAPSDTASPRADSSYWRVSGRDSLVLVWRETAPDLTVHLLIRDPVLSGLARYGDRTAPATARRVGAVCGRE